MSSSACSARPSQTTPDFATQTVLKGLINRTSSHALLKAADIIFFAGAKKKKLWVSDCTLKKKMVPPALKLTSHTSEAPVRRRLLPAHRTRPFEGDCTTGSLRPRANYRLDEAV